MNNNSNIIINTLCKFIFPEKEKDIIFLEILRNLSWQNNKVSFENRDKIENEKSLIFNPTFDNPTELFELKFSIFAQFGNKLKIHALSTLDKNNYLYKKANKTIELFNLNGENKDKNKIDNYTRKQNIENLFVDLYDLSVFWKEFKNNPNDKKNELKFFNKLKIIRNKKIGLLKLILIS